MYLLGRSVDAAVRGRERTAKLLTERRVVVSPPSKVRWTTTGTSGILGPSPGSMLGVLQFCGPFQPA